MVHNPTSSDLGVVFTKNDVVEGMLDLLKYQSELDLSEIRILEPSAGEGAFAIKIIQRLILSSQKYGFPIEEALGNVLFCEIDPIKSETLKENLAKIFENYQIKKDPKEIIAIGDFLLEKQGKQEFDLIVGNPPYLRWEKIPESSRKKYKEIFRTFIDRCDLYIPFFEKGLQLLSPGGKLSFICSNRWFKTNYGKALRTLISELFSVDYIVDLDKLDAFERKVIAYPSIITVSNTQNSNNTFHYSPKSIQEFSKGASLGIASYLGVTKLSKNNIWRNSLNKKLIQNPALEPIEKQGFRIGIGVATGKDKVFIGNKSDFEIEKELLLPIITAKELKGNCFRESKKVIINPFDEKGALIDLKKFPQAARYFVRHKQELSNRHIARKKPQAWYRTIDKIDPTLLRLNKILLPDITGNKRVFIDHGKYYPHHNLYYISGHRLEDLKVLAAMLMSDFVYDQLMVLSSNMNGGYPRWQSQNLRRLQIPIISFMDRIYYQDLVLAYDTHDLSKINQLLVLKKIEQNIKQGDKWTLFESDSEYL